SEEESILLAAKEQLLRKTQQEVSTMGVYLILDAVFDNILEIILIIYGTLKPKEDDAYHAQEISKGGYSDIKNLFIHPYSVRNNNTKIISKAENNIIAQPLETFLKRQARSLKHIYAVTCHWLHEESFQLSLDTPGHRYAQGFPSKNPAATEILALGKDKGLGLVVFVNMNLIIAYYQDMLDMIQRLVYDLLYIYHLINMNPFIIYFLGHA
ncbi:hypothetical protein ACJX0J_027165, partial [Zea mays]